MKQQNSNQREILLLMLILAMVSPEHADAAAQAAKEIYLKLTTASE